MKVIIFIHFVIFVKTENANEDFVCPNLHSKPKFDSTLLKRIGKVFKMQPRKGSIIFIVRRTTLVLKSLVKLV